MPEAYRYHRFSSKRQDKGSSIERQAERTLALCEKNGWQIVDTLEDKGRSAWKGDHLRVGELGRFKQRVDEGDIPTGTYLVIENLDRLSRQDVKFARRWIEDITDRGIIVAVCNPEILLDSEALSGSNIVSMLQYLLEAKRSTAESDRKSEFQTKNIAKFKEKAAEGIAYTPKGPAWLEGETDGRFRVIPERAALVSQIYEWCASGMGYQSITKRLNESYPAWVTGWKTGTATWKIGYVKDILTSPAVEGEWHPKGKDRKPTGEVIYNLYPRIVPAELVERARAAKAGRLKTGGRNYMEARNLFAGKVVCGHCGDRMVRQLHRNNKNQPFEYLKCIRFHHGADCENKTLYRYDRFERAALDQILHLALDSTYFSKTDDISPLRTQIAELNKAIASKEAEQKRLLGFIMRNPEADEAEAMLNELRPVIRDLKLRLEDATNQLDRAKGNVSPEEHLARVKEVQDAIYSDDPEEKEQARRKVRDAIGAIVHVVQCRRDLPDPAARPIRKTPKRQIIMTLAGGYMAYLFDNDGNLVDEIDFEGSPLLPTVLTGTDVGNAVDRIQQRRANHAANQPNEDAA